MGTPVFLYAKARTKKLCVLFCVPSPEGGCKLQFFTMANIGKFISIRPRKGCKLQSYESIEKS